MVTAPIFEGKREELDLPAPPTSVRDRAELEELLLAGLHSPKQKVTEETWEHIRWEIRRLETQE